MGPDVEHRMLGIMVGCELNVSDEYIADVRKTISSLRETPARFDNSAKEKLQGRISWISTVEPLKGERLERLLAGS